MRTITRTLAYEMLIAILADLTGKDEKDILAGDLLSELGLNETGVEKLLAAIEEEFGPFLKDEITPDDLLGLETVNDLFLFIWNAIDDRFKDSDNVIDQLFSDGFKMDAFKLEIKRTKSARRRLRRLR
ncbi:acyl carrier protein [Dyadobacter sp. CY326]|uniref:acyl carrier protein n=1 Tax=Dyadobacter sp. CY326 TaxID=2907300 RepID=UPI001F36D64E|nr:acyl carrier protein [Dyadobacter sp. CY326]MCE7066668.1 acyl carrier protein [Dyadobacter sp. CY326]